MKKILLFISLFFISTGIVNADIIEVTFSKCVDGDTAWFVYNDTEIKTRFLAIDTPETVSSKTGEQPFGKEASNFTCNKITNAKKIVLEFDENSDKLDKYDRYLVWVFVDGELLQEELIKLGYAKTAYLYGDYKYTDLLKDKELIAKKDKLGIWKEYNEKDKPGEKTNIYLIIIILTIIIFIFIFSKKSRKKIINKAKRKIKKITKKEFKKITK